MPIHNSRHLLYFYIRGFQNIEGIHFSI